MIKPIIHALISTPPWVWAIFIYLLFIGIKATRNHVVYLPKLLIIPIILTAAKYKIFVSWNSINVSVYILFIILGIVIGFFFYRNTHVKVVSPNSIKLPRTYVTLCILILFFTIKYAFGYLEETNPTLHSEYFIIETAISALFSGYFFGRAVAYFNAAHRAKS